MNKTEDAFCSCFGSTVLGTVLVSASEEVELENAQKRMTNDQGKKTIILQGEIKNAETLQLGN